VEKKTIRAASFSCFIQNLCSIERQQFGKSGNLFLLRAGEISATPTFLMPGQPLENSRFSISFKIT
jgi:hypothetical protein